MTVATDVPPMLAGFVPRARIRRVECDWLVPEEGHEQLHADVVCSLTPAQIDSIPVGDGVTLAEIWSAISPFIRSWNCLAIDTATGELKPVPPPAEIGPDAFRAVDSVIGSWLALKLRTIYFGDEDRPKGSNAPEVGPETTNAGDAD